MTLDLHEDSLILCECGLGAVILSARAVWAAVKDAEVTEKARTLSMMAGKSRV